MACWSGMMVVGFLIHAAFGDTSVCGVLQHNRLEVLEQLDCLRSITKMQSLSIQYNPVANLALFRQYVSFRLPQVRVLNGSQIHEADKALGKKIFQPIHDAMKKQVSAHFLRIPTDLSLSTFSHNSLSRPTMQSSQRQD